MSSSTIVSPGLANPEVPRPKPHNLKVIGACELEKTNALDTLSLQLLPKSNF